MILSIVIPVYNGEDYLERCVVSLMAQDLEVNNFEIIIINDGSKDGSLQIAERLHSLHPNIIRVLDQENRSLGATRNRGMLEAKAKYLYFIDVDDYLATNTLKPILSCAEKNDLQVITFESMVTHDSSLTNSENVNQVSTDVEVMDGPTYIGKLSYKNEAWWYLAKREFILSTGLHFVENKWMEDAVYTTSLLMAASRVAHFPVDAHRYMKVPNSILSKKEPSHYIKVVKDIADVAMAFTPLIEQAENLPGQEKCVRRLKTRQDSFVFFMIVRSLKSQLSFKEIWQILMRIRQTGGYPLTHFLSEEYNRPAYKILTPLFNHRSSLYLLYQGFKIPKMIK